MKIYITVILLVIANFEWIFILSNFDNIKILKNISYEKPDIKLQEEYIKKLSQETYLNTSAISIGTSEKTPQKTQISPIKLNIPSINIEAPIHTISSDFDSYLNKWVVNLKLKREGLYLFGHSSSLTKSPFQFIFTKITKMWIGDRVYIENQDKEIQEYKYINAFYKKPEKLEELESWEDNLYLITCYPFWSTYTRYIVHLVKTDKIFKK